MCRFFTHGLQGHDGIDGEQGHVGETGDNGRDVGLNLHRWWLIFSRFQFLLFQGHPGKNGSPGQKGQMV